MRASSILRALVVGAACLVATPLAAQAPFPAKGDPAKAEHRTLDFRGMKRTYLAQPVEGEGPFPLVLVLHGANGKVDRLWAQSSLPTVGAREKFIVVAPQALGRWNAEKSLGPENDSAYLRAIIREEVEKDHADPKAVFMVGMSNGGFMTIHFVCAGASELRAAGAISATLYKTEGPTCAPSKPLPWIEMHGDLDDNIPFEGDQDLMSAESTFAVMADRARCGRAVTRTMLPDVTKEDGSRAEKRVRAGCAGGTTSTLYILHGGGHNWPNSVSGPPGPRGAVNQDIDAGTVIWEHFKATLPAR